VVDVLYVYITPSNIKLISIVLNIYVSLQLVSTYVKQFDIIA